MTKVSVKKTALELSRARTPDEFENGEYFYAKIAGQEARLYVKAFETVVDLLEPKHTYREGTLFIDYVPIKSITITTEG